MTSLLVALFQREFHVLGTQHTNDHGWKMIRLGSLISVIASELTPSASLGKLRLQHITSFQLGKTKSQQKKIKGGPLTGFFVNGEPSTVIRQTSTSHVTWDPFPLDLFQMIPVQWWQWCLDGSPSS